MKIITIGVYGFDEATFFRELQQAGIDTFCDIRWRRGVRGSEYAFANSARLQKKLAALGIRYVYARELAPTPELRRRQYEADKQAGTTKRKRAALSETFIAAYRKEYLETFDARKFLESLGADARTVALFCVEREPAACHRSLIAERLQDQTSVEVSHIIPSAVPP